MYKRGNSWVSDFWHGGKRYTKSWGAISKTAAKDKDKRFWSDVAEGRYEKRTDNPLFKKFMAQYLDYSKLNKKPMSYKRDRSSSKPLLKFFAGKKLSDIHSFLVEKYKKQRQEQGKQPPTINAELRLLRHMFNKAMDWKKASTNPISRKVKLLKERERMWVLSDEEERRLFDAITSTPEAGHIEPMVICALYAGMRKKEIFTLRKDRVFFSSSYVLLEDTKNGETRKVPINSKVTSALRKAMRKNNSDYVFPGKDGGPYKNMDNAWWHVIKEAGLEREADDKLVRFRFHDLRHTFATRLGMNGYDISTVGEIIGHKDIKMTKKYSHPTPEHKMKAVESLCEVPSNLPSVAKLPQSADAGNPFTKRISSNLLLGTW